mmetsp:Transcript_4168/g.7067  ORF Transcript_4168/g.7067 Transcript_4168/m.7067 type:complete len:87 (-) Transcript_4168:194-454(-)
MFNSFLDDIGLGESTGTTPNGKPDPFEKQTGLIVGCIVSLTLLCCITGLTIYCCIQSQKSSSNGSKTTAPNLTDLFSQKSIQLRQH